MILRTILVLILASFQAQAFNEGLVQPGSLNEAKISEVLKQALTTQTGCEISNRLFLMKTDFLKRFFGLTDDDAEKIKRICPQDSKTAASIFYSTPKSRPAKTYALFKRNENTALDGWTHSHNQTDLYIDSLDDPRLRSILIHEIIITMDDKFNLTTDGFEKLGFKLKAPPEVLCKVNRFLLNPYYQLVLASLRAFWMELRFAQDLKDKNWFEELASVGLLSKRADEVFYDISAKASHLMGTAFNSQKTYTDSCTDQKFNLNNMTQEVAQALAARDLAELQKVFLDSEKFNTLLEFLTRQVSISALDSNSSNSGPRPGITPGGWGKHSNLSIKNLPVDNPLSKRDVLVPKLQDISTEAWKKQLMKKGSVLNQ